MNFQMPSWLSATIVAAVAVGAVYFLGVSTMPPEDKSVNQPAPAVDGTLLDGSAFHLSAYKGKVVLLNFWGTWCPPCRGELPDLIALQKQYGSRGFTVVGLAENREPNLTESEYRARLTKFATAFSINYPNLPVPDGTKEAYSIEAFPSTFLIDKEGKIVAVSVGMLSRDDMSKKIEKLL